MGLWKRFNIWDTQCLLAQAKEHLAEAQEEVNSLERQLAKSGVAPSQTDPRIGGFNRPI